jgi:hypothetical protein
LGFPLQPAEHGLASRPRLRGKLNIQHAARIGKVFRKTFAASGLFADASMG